MIGGYSRPAFRLTILLVLAALFLSGCSLFRAPQPPAPVRDAVEIPVEPATPPVVMEAEPEPETADHQAPKKPKRLIVKPRKPEEPPPPAPPPPPPPPAPAPIITTRLIDRNAAHGVLDAEVQRPDGKVVGRAVDMIVDASGKPREMVVNLQGFLGVGDRKVSFPWSAFRFTPTAKTATITLDMPPPSKTPPAQRPKPAAALPAPLTGVASTPVGPGQLPLLDATVERPNGAKVGRVIDVLVDAGAQPQAVVLDVSGMVSPDRRTIAADWSALRIVTKNKALTPQIDLNEAQINASPPYASDKPIRAVSPAAPAAPATPVAAAPVASAPAGASPPAVQASSARAPR